MHDGMGPHSTPWEPRVKERRDRHTLVRYVGWFAPPGEPLCNIYSRATSHEISPVGQALRRPTYHMHGLFRHELKVGCSLSRFRASVIKLRLSYIRAWVGLFTPNANAALLNDDVARSRPNFSKAWQGTPAMPAEASSSGDHVESVGVHSHLRRHDRRPCSRAC